MLTNKQVEELIKKLHAGEISLFNLPEEVFLMNFDEIFGAVKEGFGTVGTSKLKEVRLTDYKANISKFSGAKTFNNIKDMSMLIFDEFGQKQTLKKFRELVLGINEQYNVNWLKTERDTGFAMAQSADQWLINEEEEEVFPLLRYETVGDDRVRDEHAAWDGIVKPVGDPFWNTRMPINSWRCRCRVIQLDEGKVTNLDKHLKKVNKQFEKSGRETISSLKNTNKMFSVNPGKVNYIFDPKTHPYFKVENRFKPMLDNNFGFKTPE